MASRFVAKWLDHSGLMWPAILERGESPGDRRILVSGNYQVSKLVQTHVSEAGFTSQTKFNVNVTKSKTATVPDGHCLGGRVP